MGGFFSSQSQDPEILKLAAEYKVRDIMFNIVTQEINMKVPLLDAQRLTEHFRSIDWEGEGFVTRSLWMASMAMM